MDGKIRDVRFAIMTANLEAGQRNLQCCVKELRKTISAEQESNANADRFLAPVRKYTDGQKMTAEIIRAFVEKVIVHQAKKIDGHRIQMVRIVWNCIGEIDAILAYIAKLPLETA